MSKKIPIGIHVRYLYFPDRPRNFNFVPVCAGAFATFKCPQRLKARVYNLTKQGTPYTTLSEK